MFTCTRHNITAFISVLFSLYFIILPHENEYALYVATSSFKVHYFSFKTATLMQDFILFLHLLLGFFQLKSFIAKRVYFRHHIFFKVKASSFNKEILTAMRAPWGHSRYVRSPRPYRNNHDSNI